MTKAGQGRSQVSKDRESHALSNSTLQILRGWNAQDAKLVEFITQRFNRVRDACAV